MQVLCDPTHISCGAPHRITQTSTFVQPHQASSASRYQRRLPMLGPRVEIDTSPDALCLRCLTGFELPAVVIGFVSPSCWGSNGVPWLGRVRVVEPDLRPSHKSN